MNIVLKGMLSLKTLGATSFFSVDPDPRDLSSQVTEKP
jgi:hypothetical protein